MISVGVQPESRSFQLGFLLFSMVFTSLCAPRSCGKMEKSRKEVIEMQDKYNKLRYDLAMIYVNNKMKLALERGTLPKAADDEEEGMIAAHALQTWYNSCMNELNQNKDKYFEDPDFT